MTFRKFEWSAWKLLDFRILFQIPQSFWGPSAAPKPPAVEPRESTNPPLEIPAYWPDMYNYFILYTLKITITDERLQI